MKNFDQFTLIRAEQKCIVKGRARWPGFGNYIIDIFIYNNLSGIIGEDF